MAFSGWFTSWEKAMSDSWERAGKRANRVFSIAKYFKKLYHLLLYNRLLQCLSTWDHRSLLRHCLRGSGIWCLLSRMPLAQFSMKKPWDNQSWLQSPRGSNETENKFVSQFTHVAFGSLRMYISKCSYIVVCRSQILTTWLHQRLPKCIRHGSQWS